MMGLRSCLLLLVILLWSGIITATPHITVSPTKITMGEPIRVDITSLKKLKKHAIGFANRTFKLTYIASKNGRYYYSAYVAASRKLPSNTYSLKVYYEDHRHKKGFQKFMIVVDHPPKKVGKVKLSPQKNKLSRNQSQLIKESKIIAKGFKKMTSSMAFNTPFIWPAKGRLSSPFGAQRLYNGRYNRSHAGVDIANKTHTRIVAPHHGTVILSQKLRIHGNTVMINHGMGIVTIYNHLHRRYVRKNQNVKQGDRIGSMGMTGVATGPHLHWGMSVQNVRVDPLFWVKGDMF